MRFAGRNKLYKTSCKFNASARRGRTYSKQKDYHSKTSTGRTIKKIMLYSLFVAVSGWWFYFFLLSGNFAIKTVNILGLKNIPEKEIRQLINKNLESRIWGILPAGNIFLFPKAQLTQDVSEKYIVEKISIDRQLPFTININIDEKLSKLVLRVLNEVIINEEAPNSSA